MRGGEFLEAEASVFLPRKTGGAPIKKVDRAWKPLFTSPSMAPDCGNFTECWRKKSGDEIAFPERMDGEHDDCGRHILVSLQAFWRRIVDLGAPRH